MTNGNGGNTSKPIPPLAVGIAYFVLAVAGILVWLSNGGDILFIDGWGSVGAVEITAAEGFAALAVLYVCAQAIERLVEPIVSWDPFNWETKREELKKEVAEKDAKLTALVEATSEEPQTADKAADAAAEKSEASTSLAGEEKKRGLIAWAMAGVFAFLLAGVFELRLIEAIGDITVDGDTCAVLADADGFVGRCANIARIDLIVTALAIAGGTKPLHDLISRLEKAKSNADPATGKTQ